MARLIDADRLAAFPHESTSGTEDAITEWIEDIFSTEQIIDHKEDLAKLCWKAINGFIGVIETEPTVDAVKVVHGEWLSAYEYALKIGVTDEEKLEEAKKDKWWKFCNNCEQQVRGVRNYCPNCGAKMDGGDKE